MELLPLAGSEVENETMFGRRSVCVRLFVCGHLPDAVEVGFCHILPGPPNEHDGESRCSRVEVFAVKDHVRLEVEVVARSERARYGIRLCCG